MLSGEEMGIGKSRAAFSPCSPCFSGATKHAGAVNHSRQRSRNVALSPSPHISRQPPVCRAHSHPGGLSGQPQGRGPGPRES